MRSRDEIAHEPAPWAFAKGLLVGGVLEIPALASATWVLSRSIAGVASVGAAPTMEIVRMTTVFAGIPALLTAGGLGRLAAHQTTKHPRRRAILHTCAVHAMAGVLLLLIAAIPHGVVPISIGGWLLLAALGALAGALCGAGIGLVCAGATPRQVTEVLSLVKLPAATLRQIIDSEDLGRLGAAVRHRASLMFDGLLDPAAPPPPLATERKAAAPGDDDERVTTTRPGAAEAASGRPADAARVAEPSPVVDEPAPEPPARPPT